MSNCDCSRDRGSSKCAPTSDNCCSCSRRSLYASSFSFFIISLSGLLLAGFVYDFLSNYLNSQLRSTLYVLSETSNAYQPFLYSDNAANAPITATFCVYSVMNGDAFLFGKGALLPSLSPEELCLTYDYAYQHLNATFPPDFGGDVISFTTYQTYELAGGAPAAEAAQQLVTTVNVPLIAAASNPLVAALIMLEPGLAPLRNASKALISVPAAAVLFGWESDDLALLNVHLAPLGVVLPTYYSGIVPTDNATIGPASALNKHSPSYMWTGALTEEAAYLLWGWDGSQEVRCCQFGPCGDVGSGGGGGVPSSPSPTENSVGGSPLGQFHIGVSCDEILRVATYDSGAYKKWPIVCGSYAADDAEGWAYWSSQGDGEGGNLYTIQDIDVLRFRLPATAFSNQTTVLPSASSSFSSSSSSSSSSSASSSLLSFTSVLPPPYSPYGLVNATACSQGAPIFLSKPRFLDADPALAAGVEGLSPPSRPLHDSWLGIEPITGVGLDFHFRLGINARLSPLGALGDLWDTIPVTYLPIAWGSQDSFVTDALAQGLRSAAIVPSRAVEALKWTGVALASAAGAIAVIFFGIAASREGGVEGVDNSSTSSSGSGSGSGNNSNGGGSSLDWTYRENGRGGGVAIGDDRDYERPFLSSFGGGGKIQ